MLSKKIITILLVTILFAACKNKQNTSSNQDVKNNNTENNDASPKDLLVNTWKVTGDQFAGEQMGNEFNGVTITLSKDGTASAVEGKMKGKYTVGDDGKSLTTVDDEDGTVHFDILMLSKNKLKVVTTVLDKPAHTFTLESQ